ncbi:hypothetical protein ACSLNR_29925, partial [Escherichia coli]
MSSSPAMSWPASASDTDLRWLKDFGVDYDWLHLVPNGTSYEKHIKRTLAEHKGDLLIAAL